jgi:hypothetical protein
VINKKLQSSACPPSQVHTQIHTHTHTYVLLQALLGYSDEERPIALQLGGADAEMLGKAAEIAAARCQLHEINLNCGCPSSRVTDCIDCKQFGKRLPHTHASRCCCRTLTRRVAAAAHSRVALLLPHTHASRCCCRTLTRRVAACRRVKMHACL